MKTLRNRKLYSLRPVRARDCRPLEEFHLRFLVLISVEDISHQNIPPNLEIGFGDVFRNVEHETCRFRCARRRGVFIFVTEGSRLIELLLRVRIVFIHDSGAIDDVTGPVVPAMIHAPGPVLDLERHDVKHSACMPGADRWSFVDALDRIFEIIVVDVLAKADHFLVSGTRSQSHRRQIYNQHVKDEFHRKHSIVQSTLQSRIFLILWLLPVHAAFAQSGRDIDKAIQHALPILERSAGEFVAKRACVSCHHNILGVLVFHLARERGFALDDNILRAVEDKTFRQIQNPNALDDAIQAADLNDPTPNDSFLLMAAHAAGIRPGLITNTLARRLVRWQRDGHWVTSDFRPPHSSSLFTATATAVRAIRFYMPEEMNTEAEASFRDARAWLSATRPASTEDAAFRLMGLVWASASEDQKAAAERDLLAFQKPAGGWAQLLRYEPDAYSTGEALFALREAGMSTSEPVFRKGLRYLISTQASDGTWRVHTRMISPAEVSPKYFSTGFPYAKDEYLSYAGSCWAVMGLLSALPPENKGPAPQAAASPDLDAEPWVRTALFGKASQFAQLLDRGLDPNSHTEKGTSLLMMAAPEAEKVRLLLSRGANPKSRSASGVDAVTVASAYRSSSASIRLLIDAGGEAEPPAGVRVRHTPLVLASMSGDLENVGVLLSHGAKASETALSEAATFGYAGIVRALLGAGADATAVAGSGVNLLHWAAITNRPAMVPILVDAHVPIDATDDFGYTPLMYAATIDFDDTEMLKALLKAGANRTIRNDEGRTPLQQARRYKHSHMEAHLK